MKTAIYLEPSIASVLNIMAEKQNRLPDELVADLITAAHHLAETENPDPETLRQLREEISAAKQEGGISYTKGGRDWIESWASDKPLPEPPKCQI